MHTLGSLQAQNTLQCFHHTLFADHAGLVCIQHKAKVFLGIVEEQKHITAGIDGSGQHVLTLHPVSHAHHVGSIGNDHAVEAQLITQQAGHDLGAQSCGHNGVGSNLRVDLLHIFGHQDVTTHDGIQTTVDQSLVNMAVGSHPVIMTEMVHIVGNMGITVILTVAGEMLGAAVNTINFMQALHVSLTHGCNQLGVVTVSTEQNFLTLMIISNIHDRSECHVTAGSLDLGAGDVAHGLGMLRLTGSANLDLAGNESAVGADTVTTLLGVAGDKDGNLCILLQNAVLVQNHLTGHTIVTAAAQMIFLHQFLQIFLAVAGGKLPEQLTDLLFRSHGSDGAFHPGDIRIIQKIRFCFQIDHAFHISFPFFYSAYITSRMNRLSGILYQTIRFFATENAAVS